MCELSERRQSTKACLESLCPGASSLASDDRILDALWTVLSPVMSKTPNYLVAIADCIANAVVSEDLTSRVLTGLTSHVAPTLTEGQVLIVSRRALRDSYERWWLDNAVFHHPKGASIVLVPRSHIASPPLRLAPFCTLSDAERASNLFASLAWGNVMPFEDAWRTAVALTGSN